ncbi:Mitochondrial ribosomal protein [Penicillium samsonianum]|uniref:Mitochondrial ribosomal protein n=1 Tax=Penicillium samsonianum TaxID=1882272 RepID=UPI0025497293|nr:Mitochondrial ribosomal protein [Penicillium samsonianum]KAJ6132509.1 Mitochondrial ribosomal protein [Penicillium samsonianum]
MAALPAMRPLGCLRSLMRASEPIQPFINRRFISTSYSKRPERVPLPPNMPEQFLSQIPLRFRPDPERQPLKIYPAPPSARKACKDPIGAVTESQLAVLDPTGERKAMFDYRRNPRSVKTGDIVRVTFKNGDPFNGIVLSIKLRGIETSFLMRNELTRVAVEMSVKVFSPNVNSVEIVQRSDKKRRRARLYFLRDRKHDRRSVENVVASYVRQKKAFLGGGNRRR